MSGWLRRRLARGGTDPAPAHVVLVGPHTEHSRRRISSCVRTQSLPGCTVHEGRATPDARDVSRDATVLIFVEPEWELEDDFAAAVHHKIVVDGDDAVYADDSRTSRSRPDWSPESLLFRCTTGGVLALSARCWSDLGLSTPPESVHQIALQLMNANVDVTHVRAPLTRSPSAINPLVCEPTLTDADRQRVTAYAKRYGVDMCDSDDASLHFSSTAERVSLVVPTAGKSDEDGVRYIDRLLSSLAAHPSHHALDVVAVIGPEVTSPTSDHVTLTTLAYDEPFNFSVACNAGVTHASGDVVVIINDDIEVTSSDWLNELIAFTRFPGVGAVGPLLLYPDGTVQSAGHMDPGPVTFARGYRINSHSDTWVEHQLLSRRNVTGLTAACLVMRKTVLNSIGGFDPSFPIAFNDVDLGNRLRAHGLRLVYSPARPLIHYESRTRTGGASPDEERHLATTWPQRHRDGEPDEYLG